MAWPAPGDRRERLAKPDREDRTARARDIATLPAAPPRILCVDDEPAVLTILSRALGRRFEVVSVDDPLAALGLLEREETFSVVISDLKMPQMDGEDFLARAKRLAPTSARLALTGSLDRELAADQVFGVLTKPCPLKLLHESVTAAVQHHLLLTRPDSVMLAPLPHEMVLMSTSPPDHDGMDSAIRKRRVRRELLPGVAPSLPPVEWPAAPRTAAAWAQPAELAMKERVGTLALLSAVANKFFLLGQTAEAERVLRPALEDLLQRAQGGQQPSPADVEAASLLALRLAARERAPRWVDYVFRLFLSLRRPLPSAVVERLPVPLEQLPNAILATFAEYMGMLRSIQRRLGAADQILIRRLEALDPSVCP